MAKNNLKKTTTKSEDDSKIFAFLAAFLSIIGFIIAILVKREDAYVMHYAKQGLMVFIVAVVAGIAGSILAVIPFLGWLIIWAIQIVVLVLWIVSWVYALSGEVKEVPVIGSYATAWFKSI